MERESKEVHVLLLTGASGVGKTTLIRKVAESLQVKKIRGFLTEEIREGGRRVGFRLEAFDGQSAVLAHVDTRSPHRAGKYGVDVGALDRVVESDLCTTEDLRIYLVDEIGPMECFSKRFVTRMTALLESGHLIVATIHRRAGGFVQQVKDRQDVELWEVTRENRDEMPPRILAWVDNRLAKGT